MPEPSDEAPEEDPTSEARRFSALLTLLDEQVPELERWRLEGCYGDEFDSEVLTLGEAWMLASDHLFDDDDQLIDVDGVWPRLLAVIDVALDLCDVLYRDGRDDDAISVAAFAGSGIICDITRKKTSLESLLPWMGPSSLEGARVEVSSHATTRGYDIDDVDWSTSGLAFRPLAISPLELVPARRR